MAQGKAQGKTKHMKVLVCGKSQKLVGHSGPVLGPAGAAMEGMVDPDYEPEDKSND